MTGNSQQKCKSVFISEAQIDYQWKFVLVNLLKKHVPDWKVLPTAKQIGYKYDDFISDFAQKTKKNELIQFPSY